MADVKKEICGFKPSWSFVPLVVDEFGTLARTLIHIDKDAIGAVHDVSLRRWTSARGCDARGTEMETRERPAMMTRSGAQQIAIRDLKSIDDLSQLKAVEKEVWGMADEDTLPLTLAIACKAAGNIFVGAFDKEKNKEKDKLVGFAFGFLGREHGQTTIHSHMLAVLDSYRHLDLGSRLKQAQRERAMAMGVREMT